MGICFTNTQPFDVISLQDGCFLEAEVPDHIVRHYEMTRDINDLPMDQLNALSDKPVIFTVKPLTVLFENVVFPFTDMHSARAVFREHVIDVKNVSMNHKRKDKDGKLSNEACELYPMNIITEIAQVVIESQQRVPGGSVPFTATQSDGFSARKTALRRKTHLVALMENVNGEDAEIKD